MFNYLILLFLSVPLLAGACNFAPATDTEAVVVEENQEQVFFYEGVEGVDAMSLLKEKFEVETEDFGSGIGEFVSSIEGIAPARDEFWIFIVNGETSNVGASQYVTKIGDRLEWKLEKIDNY